MNNQRQVPTRNTQNKTTGARPKFNLCVFRENESGESESITIASLWEKKSQAGQTQYSGKVNSEFLKGGEMVNLPLNKDGRFELLPDEWLNLFIVKAKQ